jgi:signal peptidase II
MNETESAAFETPSRPPPPVRLATPPETGRPSYRFFGAVAALALMADVASKAWAEITLTARTHDPAIRLVENHLSLSLAYNRGGAWGLLQNASEVIRRPFFLGVSFAAVVFIVSLYSRLLPGQRALKWGLPLVLGGALGNLTDRVVRTSVVDFIDYRADWITKMNEGIATLVPTWNVTDHWPTFNVADMCICAGVALMAIDMLASKHPPKAAQPSEAPVAGAGV